MSPFREYTTPLERDLAAENENLRHLAREQFHEKWRERDARANAELRAWTWRLVAFFVAWLWVSREIMLRLP